MLNVLPAAGAPGTDLCRRYAADQVSTIMDHVSIAVFRDRVGGAPSSESEAIRVNPRQKQVCPYGTRREYVHRSIFRRRSAFPTILRRTGAAFKNTSAISARSAVESSFVKTFGSYGAGRLGVWMLQTCHAEGALHWSMVIGQCSMFCPSLALRVPMCRSYSAQDPVGASSSLGSASLHPRRK